MSKVPKWVIKNTKPVIVLWEDACHSLPHGRMSDLEEETNDPWIVGSIGFLVIDKPDYIVMVESLSGEGEVYSSWNKIPRAYIKSIHKLK